LLGSLPRLDEHRHDRLTPTLGTPPSLVNLPPGCPFAPRCPMAEDICREHEPPLAPVGGPGQQAACHFSDRLTGVTATDLFKPIAFDMELATRSEELQRAPLRPPASRQPEAPPRCCRRTAWSSTSTYARPARSGARSATFTRYAGCR